MAFASLVGNTFERYELLDLLGHGAFSAVYRAIDVKAEGGVVALKVFPAAFMRRQDFATHFDHDVRNFSRLQHPNIVPLLRYGRSGGFPFLVLPYFSGGSLEDLIRQRGTLNGATSLEILIQVSQALEHAHQRGVIHRALTASNILFDEARNAYLTDFSLPSIRQASAIVLNTPVGGPPSTMPPEVARGEAPTPASDVYSMGIVLYAMLTGEYPYQADTAVQQMMLHINAPVPDPRRLNPTVDPTIASVVTRAMAKEPGDRFSRVDDLISALRRILESPSSLRVPPSTLSQQPDLPQDSESTLADDQGGVQPRSVSAMRSQQETIPEVRSEVMHFRREPEGGSPSVRKAKRRAERQYLRERRAREREMRRQVSGGLRWYAVLGIVLVVLLVAGIAASELGLLALPFGEIEVRVPAVEASTQTATVVNATETANAAATSTFQALVAEIRTATAESGTLAMTATAGVWTETPTPTIQPSATPSPTATQFAGSNQWIAYISERDGDPDIFLLEIQTGRQVRVTRNDGFDSGPAWSPNGQLLAYYSSTDEGGHLFVLDVACAEAGPDGCENAAQQLTTGDSDNQTPVWSPSGRQIVFVSEDEGEWRFRSITLDGTPSNLAQIDRNVRLLEWSADGALVFFGPGEGGNFEVFRLPPGEDYAQRLPITDANGSIEHVDYSPTDGIVVYSALIGSRRKLFLADTVCEFLEECVVRPLTDEDSFTYFTPRFSPDGTAILVAANRQGNLDLFVMGREGEVLRQLTDQPYDEYSGVWQPLP